MCWDEGSAGGRAKQGRKEDSGEGDGVCDGVREDGDGGGEEICSAEENECRGFLFCLGLSR